MIPNLGVCFENIGLSLMFRRTFISNADRRCEEVVLNTIKNIYLVAGVVKSTRN